MFHVNNIKMLRQIANSIGEDVNGFDGDDEVWRGDDGSFLIGDAGELDEDEIEMYRQAGTLGEYTTKDLTD